MTLTLAKLQEAGMVSAATIRLTRHLGFLYDESDEVVLATVACTIHALSLGSICFDISAPHGWHQEAFEPTEFEWPTQETWLAFLIASTMVSTDLQARDRPVILDGNLVYLTRYWADQQTIVDWLRRRLAPPASPGNGVGIAAETALPSSTGTQQAARLAADCAICVIAGGPGTGKTTSVAQILAALARGRQQPLTVILTAPTGRAAAHLDQAVQANLRQDHEFGTGFDVRLTSGTLHRILGIKPWGATDHGAHHPLPADVVVVDEASMLSLRLMSRLLDAIGPVTRLILVGDPDQLASVDAGAVLADLVEPGTGVPAIRLNRNYRFTGAIADLADSIRRGQPDEALAILQSDPDTIEWLSYEIDSAHSPETLTGLRAQLTQHGLDLIAAGQAGDVTRCLELMDSHRLLLAHRHGPTGASYWSQVIQQWIGQTGVLPSTSRWYAGLPVLITRNDDLLSVFNGDCGVIVNVGDPRLALPDKSGWKLISPDMIEFWEPAYASTIHKAQGSQYGTVSLILPPPDTVLLTRQLFYTAVTRAKNHLRIVGSPDAVRQAIITQARRASGLAGMLQAHTQAEVRQDQ